MRLNKDRLQMYISLMKITIVLCWLSLFSFWAIKLFGGNWFEIMVENENFVKFSNAVQNTWLKYLVSFITVGVAKYFTLCAISQRFIMRGKHLAYLIISITSIWAITNFVPMSFISFPAWYAYVIYFIYSFVYQTKWRKLYGLIAIGLEFAFSTISMLTRNIPLEVISEYLIAYILSIDVYIMIIIYYLYANLTKINKEK